MVVEASKQGVKASKQGVKALFFYILIKTVNIALQYD